MARKANVLVTAVGGIVGQGIIKCLKFANVSNPDRISYKILSADASPQAAGLYRSDGGFIVPSVSARAYLDSVIKICKAQSVEAIFVGADEELLSLASAAKRIEEESGARIISNTPEVISVAGDKWRTYEFLKKNGLPCAESSLPENLESFVGEYGFPIVVKPREGHGSEHFYLAREKEEVSYAVSAIQRRGWRPLLQEYLSAEDSEFTTGVTIDEAGGTVLSSIAIRRTLKGGQTYKAFIDDFPETRKSAEEVALRLGGRGPVNVQSRLAGDETRVFEINPRFSATCPLRAVAGVNEPDLLFRNFRLGEAAKIEGYERMVCFRYWNEVYLPYPEYERVRGTGTVGGSDSFIPDYF